jgi:WhiB family redox-sensing transcriptional regulator
VGLISAQGQSDQPAPGQLRLRAECRNADPNLFFPSRAKKATVEQAKALCAVCPVADECLQTALRECHEHGIWGGLTPLERRRLLFRRELASAYGEALKIRAPHV